jgi:hypothetical protein
MTFEFLGFGSWCLFGIWISMTGGKGILFAGRDARVTYSISILADENFHRVLSKYEFFWLFSG